MSDEALNARLDWLDKAQEKEDDYEIWLEKRVEELEAAVALAKQRTGRFTSDLLKSGDLVEIAGEFVPRSQLEDDVLRNTISMLKNENERLTKHVEDYKEENAALSELLSHLVDVEMERDKLKAENAKLKRKYEYAVGPCALIPLLEKMKDHFGLMSVHSEGAKRNATLVSLLHQLKRIREEYKEYLTEQEQEK